MPKIKTNRGAAKRFRVTAKGGIKHRCAQRNHILTKKSAKRKRQLRGTARVFSGDQLSVERMLTISS